METGKWREIRTFGAGSKDFHDKIKTRTSCGVRVGSVVGAVPVEAVVVVGGRAGSAVLAAAGALIVFLWAMLVTSVELRGWLIGVGTGGGVFWWWYWSVVVVVVGTIGSIVVDRMFSSFVGNKQKEEEEEVQVREDLNRYKYLLEQKFILSGV